MGTALQAVLAAIGILAGALGPALGGYRMTDGAFEDPARGRTLPYRMYLPAPLKGPHPVILVSHGVGGARTSMPYLGRALAENGYVAVHLQHPGSDESVWRGEASLEGVYRRLREAMFDGAAAQARFSDVPFVLNELTRMNSAGPLAGELDLSRVGMAGHSYGGVSTMVAAGQRMGPNGTWFYKEGRVKAGFVMSPGVPIQGGDLAALYRDIGIPLFHATGTRDGNAVPGNPEFDPVRRTIPYQALRIPHQYLLVLKDAAHNSFSGLEHGPHAHGAEVETRYTRALAEAAVLFFDAYVKGDGNAEKALRETFKSRLDPGDRFEWK